MDDRTITPAPMEHPGRRPPGPRRGPAPFPVDDPRALTILTTEHWSLLSARSLVYNEAFARAGMFLSFLAATLVALGLMSGAMGFSDEFLGIVALVLGLDLFIGLATMGRVPAPRASGSQGRCAATRRSRPGASSPAHGAVRVSPATAPTCSRCARSSTAHDVRNAGRDQRLRPSSPPPRTLGRCEHSAGHELVVCRAAWTPRLRATDDCAGSQRR